MCKICPKCKIEKEFSLFGKDKNQKDGLTRMCKLCKNTTNGRTKEQNKTRYQNNIEKERARSKARRSDRLAYNKIYYEKTKDQFLTRQKEYHEANKERINSRRRAENLTTEELELKNKKVKAYIYSDPVLKFKYRLRCRISHIFKAKGMKKDAKAIEYVGCTVDFLKGYIEAQFQEGMTWENNTMFGWHLDHIIPLSSAKTVEEVKALCHYSNLQPLWHYENKRKSNTMPKSHLKIAV